MRPRPIVIYAATGYTGRLIAGELLERGERAVLAGRDAAKLSALAQRFGEGVAAAAAAGSHYLDTTGEQDWIRRVFAFSHTPGDLLAHLAVVPALTPLLGRLLRSPLKSLVGRAIDTLPEGPAEEDRRAARWTIVAGADGEDGRTARGIVQGTDIYGLTAKTITQAPIELADPTFTGSGALAPAQAVDPARFLDGLAQIGVSWRVDAPRPALTEVRA